MRGAGLRDTRRQLVNSLWRTLDLVGASACKTTEKGMDSDSDLAWLAQLQTGRGDSQAHRLHRQDGLLQEGTIRLFCWSLSYLVFRLTFTCEAALHLALCPRVGWQSKRQRTFGLPYSYVRSAKHAALRSLGKRSLYFRILF